MSSIARLRTLPTAKAWILVFSAVALVAFSIRLVEIGYNFDSDEVFSMRLVSGTWWDVIARSLVDKPHPPLHNLLLHLWVGIWGVSETKLRMLSVLLSLAGVITALAILRPRVGIFVALCAGLTIAFSGFLAYESQEARPYALIFFAGSFNIYSFLAVLDEPTSRRSIVLWTMSAAILVWSHYIGAIYLFVEACIVLIRFPIGTALRPLLPTTLAGATILPWMWVAFRTTWSLKELAWNNPPLLRDLPDFYLGAIGWPPVVSGWVLLFVTAALVTVGLYSSRSRLLPWDVIALATIAVMPPIIVFALSHIMKTSIWAERQIITSALAFILLLFILVNSLPAIVRTSVALLVVVWAIAGSSDGHQSSSVPPWRDIVLRIKRADSHATILVDEQWSLRPIDFYTENSPIRVVDLRTPNAKVPKGTSYLVCRQKKKADLCHLQGQGVVLRDDAPFARDLWNTASGKPRSIVFTYKAVRTN